MLQLAMTAVPTPAFTPLTESDRAQPPAPGDGSDLLLKRSGMSPSSAIAVGRTAEANNEFASYADAAVAAKPLEP